MIREKIKWLDPFTQLILLWLLVLVFILLSKKFYYTVGIIGITFIRALYMLKRKSGLILENEYPGEF